MKVKCFDDNFKDNVIFLEFMEGNSIIDVILLLNSENFKLRLV